MAVTTDVLTKISKAMGVNLGDLLRACKLIDTDNPQNYFSTAELFNKIPEKYKDLFKGNNEVYIEFARKMLAKDVSLEKLEKILDAFLEG